MNSHTASGQQNAQPYPLANDMQSKLGRNRIQHSPCQIEKQQSLH